jgi:hypothetical protein
MTSTRRRVLSLRKEFLEAKNQPRDDLPFGLEGVNLALKKFAEQLPNEISSLIKRMKMGETVDETLEPGLSVGVFFCAAYLLSKPVKETLEIIPGYRLLLNTCASPDVDVCCSLNIYQKDYYSSPVFQVTIAPAEGFEKSELRVSLGKIQSTFDIGKEDWAPRLDKPKLRVPSPRTE